MKHLDEYRDEKLARTLVERLRPDGLKPGSQSLELKFEIVKRSSA